MGRVGQPGLVLGMTGMTVLTVLAAACSGCSGSSRGNTSRAASVLQPSVWTPATEDFPKNGTITSVTPATPTEPWIAVGWTTDPDGHPATGCFLWPGATNKPAWTPCPLTRVDGDGIDTQLLTVGRLGPITVAAGQAFSAIHGNPRPTLWQMMPGGPLAEVRLPRELFGGERIISFNGLAGGPLGGFAVGTWDGVTNQAVAQVWRTTDGADWQRQDGVATMTSTREELFRGSAVAVGPHRVVVAGAAFELRHLDDGDDGAIWWSDDGHQWNRADLTGARLTGPGNQELQLVAAIADGFVAGGFDSATRTATLWWSPDGRSWHRADPLPGGRGGHTTVTAIVAAGARRWAAGVVDGAPRLWSSPDGRQWVDEPLPPATPSTGIQSVALASSPQGLLVVVQTPDGPHSALAPFPRIS